MSALKSVYRYFEGSVIAVAPFFVIAAFAFIGALTLISDTATITLRLFVFVASAVVINWVLESVRKHERAVAQLEFDRRILNAFLSGADTQITVTVEHKTGCEANG